MADTKMMMEGRALGDEQGCDEKVAFEILPTVTAPCTCKPPFFHAGTVVAVDRTVPDTPVPCELLLRALPRRFRL